MLAATGQPLLSLPAAQVSKFTGAKLNKGIIEPDSPPVASPLYILNPSNDSLRRYVTRLLSWRHHYPVVVSGG